MRQILSLVYLIAIAVAAATADAALPVVESVLD